MNITAGTMHFKDLNDKIRTSEEDVTIEDCLGQRYIGSGLGGKKITINGVPGNALGSYLDGAEITVNGNVQDAVGDTMNEGKIIVHGNAGDALGYAMRGGAMFIKGNTGYRTGIHMKEYKEKKPVIVVGGKAGSFLGEYLAGGIIIILNLIESCEFPAGNFTGTGMHGGSIYMRCENLPDNLPAQVEATPVSKEELSEIEKYVREFSEYFSEDADKILEGNFYVLRANSKNPYHQLYTAN